MYRRRLLRRIGAACLPLLAGCRSTPQTGDDGGTDDPASPSGTESPTTTSIPSRTSTATPYARGSPHLIVRSKGLHSFQGQDETDYFATASIENVGDRTAVSISADATFLDADGDRLQSMSDHLAYLRPGERWIAHIPDLDQYEGSGPTADDDHIDSVDVTVSHSDTPFRPRNDAFEVVDSTLTVGTSAARIDATIANTGDEAVPYFMTYGRFETEPAVALASRHRTVQDLGVGESRRVTVGLRNEPPSLYEKLASHEVLVAGGTGLW